MSSTLGIIFVLVVGFIGVIRKLDKIDALLQDIRDRQNRP
jgi:hypothetical protein